MSKFLTLLLALSISCSAFAAPQKVTVVYEATRNGQPFAIVTESFVQENSQGTQRYRIESLTSGIGVFALLGKRKLVSEGEVGATGLRPSHFEQLQGDKKKAEADFDWKTSTITLTTKGKSSTSPLEAGTVDLASYAYQFMFVPPAGDVVSIALTTGKKLRTYRFTIAQRDEVLPAVMGGTKTVHLINTNKSDNGDEKEIWLASDHHYIPAKIITSDDTGAKIEQILTSLSIE